MTTKFTPMIDLALKLIAEQFPEYSNLPITDVEKQGHDNRTYRLGEHMLVRMPTAADYALKVPKEQELLPQLAKCLKLVKKAAEIIKTNEKEYFSPVEKDMEQFLMYLKNLTRIKEINLL